MVDPRIQANKMLGRYVCLIFSVLILYAPDLQSRTLSKEQAVGLAMEHNPVVQAANKEWAIYRALKSQAWAPPEPEFELEYEELAELTATGDYGDRKVGFNQLVEFPLEWWYRGRSWSKKAESVQYSRFEMARLETSTLVKVAFDRVLFSQQVLEYSELNLELARDFYSKSREKFEAGEVAELEVLRASVEESRAENRVTATRSELAVSKAALSSLLAEGWDSSFDLTGEFSHTSLNIDFDRLKTLALEYRPDLRGARLNTVASKMNRSMAVYSAVPGVNLGVSRQTISNTTGNEKFWRLRLGVNLPLWAPLRQKGRISQATAERDQAFALQEGVHYTVLLEVEEAYSNLQSAEKQVETFENRILPESERASEMSLISYGEGKSSYLEVLEAQRVLTQVRVEYAESVFNSLNALATLERAVGIELTNIQ
ncbi:TolC family protein [Gemmatimonadota bacterium]